MQDPPLSIGVVVPAYNAADTITPCLAALGQAGFAAPTICVVDDGSTDDTAALARAQGVQVLPVPHPSGAAAARNRGAAAQGTDILLFVDADVTVAPDVLGRLQAHFAGPIDAVFGAYDTQPHHTAPLSRLRNLYHHHTHKMAAGPVASFWTGLGAVRRAVFEDLGGFDAEMRMLEDIEFGLRLHGGGHATLLDPDLQGAHWKEWRLGSMIRTDLWDRAVPWTKLLQSPLGRSAPEALNVSSGGKASVLGAGLICLALPLLVLAPWMAIALALLGLTLICVANRAFLRFIRHLDGWRQVPWACAMLLVHFTCAGLGFALVRLRLV